MNNFYYQPHRSIRNSWQNTQSQYTNWTQDSISEIWALSLNSVSKEVLPLNIESLMKSYCLWDDQVLLIPINSFHIAELANCSPCFYNYGVCDSPFRRGYSIIKRTRKNWLPNVDKNLEIILRLACQGNQISFKQSKKWARGLFYGTSKRRSKYIGVLRNREKWQILINEGNKKKYIRTYMTEIEAAVASDFYSIGINGLSAKTNFSYSHDQVMEMINQYFTSDNQFNPSILISLIHI